MSPIWGLPPNVALDLDGVVYRGEVACPGAPDANHALRGAGARVTFTTNNSATSARRIAARLSSLGVPCGVDDVVTSGQLAAAEMQRRTPPGTPVLVLGSNDLEAELLARGFSLTSAGIEAGAVVVGLDRRFSYERLAAAVTAVRRGVPFVACNRDALFPSGSTELPGCGPIVAAIEMGAGRSADAVVGKPSPAMLAEAAHRSHTEICDWIVVGDSVDSDVAMANACGVSSVLVSDPGGDYPTFARFVSASLGMPVDIGRDRGTG